MALKTSKKGLIAGVCAAVLGVALMAGCAQTPKGGYTITDGQVDYDGTTLTVTLNCEGEPDWEAAVSGDGIEADGETHEASENADVFTFKGTGEGSATIIFTYPSEDPKTVTVETTTDASGQFISTGATGSDGSMGSTQG